MSKAILFFVWITFLFWILAIGYDLVNKPSTIGNTVGVIILAGFVLVSVKTKCFTSITTKSKKKQMKTMKSKILGFIMAFCAMCMMSSCGYERVDAGHEGILVNLYGDDKGVGDVSMCTGAVWHNPFTQSVYEYPTFVQTVDYEPFTINAKDGSEFTVDPTISLKIVDGKSPAVFKKYRKELKDIVNGTLYNYVKDAFRIQLNNFTTDYIVSNRDSIESAIERHLSTALLRENFQLEQLTSGLKYPQTIVDAVNQKNKAVQEAQTALNQVAVAEANAKKLLVAAQAEAEANRLKQQALTPQILEKMWIEKWDGKLPQYGQVPTLFKDITK